MVLQRIGFPCETPIGGALLQLQADNSGELRREAEPMRRMRGEACESRLGPLGHRATCVAARLWQDGYSQLETSMSSTTTTTTIPRAGSVWETGQ